LSCALRYLLACLSPTFFSPLRLPPTPTLFPYTTLFRSLTTDRKKIAVTDRNIQKFLGKEKYSYQMVNPEPEVGIVRGLAWTSVRSEEHTSELQSRFDLVCRLLLEKKKQKNNSINKTIDE